MPSSGTEPGHRTGGEMDTVPHAPLRPIPASVPDFREDRSSMLKIEVPGCEPLLLSDLVLDYNGTIAAGGKIIDGVKERLEVLSRSLDIHVLTADTFGNVRSAISEAVCRLFIIPPDNQAQAKADYVRRLGCERAVCVGNGRNDTLMLGEAALGIAVIQSEGAFSRAVLSADVVTTGILDALDLLIHPLRLAATLRT